MENKDTIDISRQNYYDADGFRKAAADCLELIYQLILFGQDIPAKEIAERAYFLHWILRDTEIVYVSNNSTTHNQ